MPNALQITRNPPTVSRIWKGSKWIRPEKRKAIYRRDGCRCTYCDATTNLSLDHIIPASRGGHNFECNLTTSCLTCNKRRQDMEFECFMRKIAPRDHAKRIKRVRGNATLPLKQFQQNLHTVVRGKLGTKPN